MEQLFAILKEYEDQGCTIEINVREKTRKKEMGEAMKKIKDSPFKECEVLSYLTGVIYWCFHRGVVYSDI